MPTTHITSPDDPNLAELCSRLAEMSGSLEQTGCWPEQQLQLCGEYGVYRWFLDEAWGGNLWNEEEVVHGYLALSAACLTTTFVLTQRTGACRRIATSTNDALHASLLPGLASGELFATVGISHLTTSRRHLDRPVLRAERSGQGFVLDGYSPWVTGGEHAQYVVVGATLIHDDQPTNEQLLVALPTDLPGVRAAPPAQMVGLTASRTGPLHLDRVEVDERWVLAGPVENVMSRGIGSRSGGHETSTLALGLARAAVTFLQTESEKRDALAAPACALREEYERVEAALFSTLAGTPACSTEQLRQQANSLALRASQAALAAAKGTGYVVGHPAGRWCREALFFLVWSCPQPVVNANLCELAGITE